MKLMTQLRSNTPCTKPQGMPSILMILIPSHFLPSDCPVVEMAAREACFFENNVLLAEREQIEQLAEVVKKVRSNAGQLNRINVDEKKHMGSAVLAEGRLRAAASST